jgi:hypothetical protein
MSGERFTVDLTAEDGMVQVIDTRHPGGGEWVIAEIMADYEDAPDLVEHIAKVLNRREGYEGEG